MPINDPRDIPGLRLWLSAEAEPAGNVTTWHDLSGLGHHAANAIGAGGGVTPASSMGPGASMQFAENSAYAFPLATVKPDGASSPGLAAAELFLSCTSTDYGGVIWAGGVGVERSHHPYFDDNFYEAFGSANRPGFNPGIGLGAAHRMHIKATATEWSARINEVTRYTGANPGGVQWPADSAQCLIGTGGGPGTTYGFNGSIGCVLIYGRTLTLSERADVDAWLAANMHGGTPHEEPEPPPPVGRPAPGVASQIVLAAVGLDPSPIGPDAPAQQWWDVGADGVATYNAARSEGLFSYAIGYGSRDPLGKPQPFSVGVAAVVPIGEAVRIGDRFQLRLSPTLTEALGLDEADAVRATCIVTDVTSDPTKTWTLPGHGPATMWNITATGWLSRYGAARLDGTSWPVEPVGARIGRILDSLGLSGDVDQTGAAVLPPAAVGTHHAALAAATDSTSGRLVEQRDGTVDYRAPDDRRGQVPALTLDASEILGENFSWRQSVGDVVNEAEITYGTETGAKAITRDPASADPRTGVGPYPAQVTTALVHEADAYSLGNEIVGRRAWPYYQLPAVTVDLARSGLDNDRLAAAFGLANSDRVALADMPAGSPWTDLPRGCFVEGYTETAVAYAWRISYVVSDPALSGVSLRYVDVPPGITYADVAPGLTYLDVARIEDPADLI